MSSYANSNFSSAKWRDGWGLNEMMHVEYVEHTQSHTKREALKRYDLVAKCASYLDLNSNKLKKFHSDTILSLNTSWIFGDSEELVLIL